MPACPSRASETSWSATGRKRRCRLPAEIATTLKYILVPRGQKFIKAVPEVLDIDEQGARLALPEISFEISHRKVDRQRCRDICVYVIQNSTSFSGALLDFTA